MSFLFPIVLVVITLLVYISLFVHNRAVLEVVVSEAVVSATMQDGINQEELERAVRDKCMDILNKRLFGVKTKKIQITTNLTAVSAEAEIELNEWSPLFNMWGYVANRKVSASARAEFFHPERIIRLANRLREGIQKEGIE